MKRAILLFAVLALCLPMVGEGQSIQYKSSGVSTSSTGGSFFAGGVSLGNTSASPYANLFGDAANTLALRNSTNAQAFNIYNTYTDGSNYERGALNWYGNSLYLLTEKAGTGTSRGIILQPASGIVQVVGSLAASGDDVRTLGTSALKWQELQLSRSIQGSKTKALTEGSPTTVATVAVPQTAGSNFAAGEVRYTVYASDGTDTQTLNGSAFFSAVNKAGTETCQLTDDQIGTEAASAGTLVCTVACATGLTDVVGITFDCTSSLTQTSLNALVRFDMQQPNTLAFP